MTSSPESLLQEYQQALEAEALASYELEQLRIRVKILRIKLQLNQSNLSKDTAAGPKLPSRTELFLKQHGKRLSQDDREFLRKESRPAAEVADYLVKHRNFPAQALKQGIFRPGIGDSPKKRMIDTISVVEHVLSLKDQSRF